MSEAVIHTCFDGSDLSFLAIQQALFLYNNNQMAIQLKNYDLKNNWRYLNYYKNHDELKHITEYEVVKNAKNIYFVDSQFQNININPATYNILVISSFNVHYLYLMEWIDYINKFDAIFVPNISIKILLENIGVNNISVFNPNILFYQDNLNIINSNFNILCSFPRNGLKDFQLFLEAYLQIPIFKNAELLIVSDVLVGNVEFYDKIKEKISVIKSKYNIGKDIYKIKLLYHQTPININHCIINSDLIILPYNDSHWSFIAMQAAVLTKQIVLTLNSNMAKNIYNCDIITDLSKNNKNEQYIEFWKILLNDLKLNKNTKLIISNYPDFLTLCNKF